MANPFYVQPGGDFGQQLSGLGQAIGEFGRQRQAKQRFNEVREAMQSAWESGDSDQISQLMINYPEARQTMEVLIPFRDQESKKQGLETYRNVLSLKDNPQEAVNSLQRRVDYLDSRGIDSSHTKRDLDALQSAVAAGGDAAPVFSAMENAYAALASPQEWESYKSQSGYGAGSNIGTYNPRDYTTESWSKFLKTGDASALERYESESIVDIGGAKYSVNRVTGARTPISTPEEEASGRAQIASAIQKAKEDAKIAASKIVSESLGSAKLSDAQSAYNALSSADLNLIYGRGEAWYPEFFRSQKGIDLIAQRDKLVGMLKMGARGELKGQGSVSDSEQKMLSQSITALENPNISPELARKELEAAINILERNAGTPEIGGEDKEVTPTGRTATNPNTGQKVQEMSDGSWRSI